MNFFWKVKSRVSLSHRELSFVGLLKACPGQAFDFECRTLMTFKFRFKLLYKQQTT